MKEARHGAGRLAHDGHIWPVAAKGRNVITNPLEGNNLVVEALQFVKVNFNSFCDIIHR